MLRAFRANMGEAVVVEAGGQLPADVAWVDLLSPTRAEEQLVETALKVSVPTRAEMLEIEPSSRLYQDNGATFLTANIVVGADTPMPTSEPVTFVLADNRLITVRYAEPKSFGSFASHVARQPLLCASGPQALVNMLEAIVDRVADLLEHIGAHLDNISRQIFRRSEDKTQRMSNAKLQDILSKIGCNQDLLAKVRDSLVSLGRMISFLQLPLRALDAKDLREHAETLARDVGALTEHSAYLTGNVGFLLNAALGLINIEQNAIIKIFSVAAVVFLPPTLVASIYGMNFEHMPELKLSYGYPLAIGLMLLSALLPYLFFKNKGWL